MGIERRRLLEVLKYGKPDPCEAFHPYLAGKLLPEIHPLVTDSKHDPGKLAKDFRHMRRTSRRDHSDEPGNHASKMYRRNSGSKGPWEFASSGRLFSMGATDTVRRAAYRAADGAMRFLPL